MPLSARAGSHVSRTDHGGQAAHVRRAAALRAGGGGAPAGRLRSSTPPSTDNPLWKAISRLATGSVTVQGARPPWPLPASQPVAPPAAEDAETAPMVEGLGGLLVEGLGGLAAESGAGVTDRGFAGLLHTQQPEEAAHGALCQCPRCSQHERVTCSQ